MLHTSLPVPCTKSTLVSPSTSLSQNSTYSLDTIFLAGSGRLMRTSAADLDRSRMSSLSLSGVALGHSRSLSECGSEGVSGSVSPPEISGGPARAADARSTPLGVGAKEMVPLPPPAAGALMLMERGVLFEEAMESAAEGREAMAEAGAGAGAGAEVEAEAEAGGEPRSIIDQMEEQLSQWAGQGHHEVIPGLEEIINQTIEEAAGQANHGPPPASKAAVQALRRVEVTQERLDEVGAGTECAVCREELKLGEEVQQMPCNKTHVFHPDCLKPWLDAHNSCPVCRFELPTDDHDYERAKEVAKERAEERQGVENALPGAEFMYI
mmetsp:Transcript_5046/g.16460  ORF Transcript_5046/g.16460 Transcript_5046/m.16460 type:complete len:324 (+) Transcript_5046:279-1250(+)